MNADLDAIRARHREHVHVGGCHRWFDHDLTGPAGYCEAAYYNEEWPCDAARLLAMLESERVAAEHPGPHEFRTTCQLCGKQGWLNVALLTADETFRIEPPRPAALSRTEP